MAESNDYSYISGGPNARPMQDPCLLDCPTEGETIALTIDRAMPVLLFISIGGELRRAVDLTEFQLHFETRAEAMHFLESVRDSEEFAEMISGEESMNEEWDSM